MSQPLDPFATDDEPLFNIGAVSRMTDISETALRVWERRYDFPKSTRTNGGHRLYSQQEVMRLQWVKQRTNEGMQISQAIRALHHHEREDDSERMALSPVSFPQPKASGVALSTLQKMLFDRLVQHDAEQAAQTLTEGLALFPVEHLILDLIAPTLSEIGEAWMDGRMDIATEHFATNFLRHELLTWMRTAPPAYHVNPVVLACAPGELHEGSLLMLAVLLRRLRWPVVYLGQTTPLSDLTAFVEDIKADLLVFVAMTEETARALVDWPHWLPESAQNRRLIVTYGGRIFSERPELTEQMPGVFLGKTLQEGVEKLDRMLHDLNPLLR